MSEINEIKYVTGSFSRAKNVWVIDANGETLLIVNAPHSFFKKTTYALLSFFLVVGALADLLPSVRGLFFLGWLLGIWYLWRVILKDADTIYPLNKGVAYCEANIHQTSETEIAWGGALARMILLGAAGAAMENRHGFLAGAAVGSSNLLNTHKVTTKEFVLVDIYFMDGNHLQGKTSEGVAELLMGVAIFNDAKDFSRLGRMEQDAKRVLAEVQAEVGYAQKEFERLAEIAEHGETFNKREDAENEARQVCINAYKKKVLFEHLQNNIQQQEQVG